MEYIVDILMPVYNHESFLEDSLNGIISQKTDFKFRLIIGEDCSTDGSKQVIERYRLKYPDIIFPFYREKNLGAYENSRLLFKEVRSKYIALCEGDDFWTDVSKLQKQVRFLETNPDYVMCFTNAFIMDLRDGGAQSEYCDYSKDQSFNQRKLLADNFSIPTLTMIYRNCIPGLPDWFHKARSGDTFLQLILSRYGKFRYMHEFTGIYRSHAGGISNFSKVEWLKNTAEYLPMLEEFISPGNKKVFFDYINTHRFEVWKLAYETGDYATSRKYISDIKKSGYFFYWQHFFTMLKFKVRMYYKKLQDRRENLKQVRTR